MPPASPPISPKPAKPSNICARPRSPQTAARGAAIRIEFGGFPDLTEAVHKLRIEGASLEGKEIFDLFGVLDRAADAKSILNAVAERFPRLGRARPD